MKLEIIFHKKKQKRSEKNCIKRKLSIKCYQKKTIKKKKKKKVQKNIKKYFKIFKKDSEKIQKYHYNITYGLNYLFIEKNEDPYEPIEIKSAFDGSYIQYKSIGDRDANLSLDEYLNIIRPYLRDMIDDHKARGEWKIHLILFLF